MGYTGYPQIHSGAVTSNDATAMMNLGTIVQANGNLYQYVKFDNGDGNVAAAAGNVCYWYTASTFVVTSDYSYAGSSINLIAGVFQAVLTDAYYGFIQLTGRYATVNTDAGDDIAKGDFIIGAAADGTVNSVAAGTAPTYQVIGRALAADVDADDTVEVLLSCLGS